MLSPYLVSLWLVAQADLVSLEAYSIRRFGEVLESAVEDTEATPQERLIALRAKLAIAERHYADLQAKRKNAKTSQEQEAAPRVVQLRAAEARIDHYQAVIRRIEQSVLKKRAQTTKSQRPAGSKSPKSRQINRP